MVDVCVLGPSKSFLQEALVRDLDPRTHQGGDDVVFDFSIRVRHAATSDDVGRFAVDPSSRENSAAGKHRHSKAEFSGTKSAVRLRTYGVQSGTACPSTGRLAALPSILPRGGYGGN
jgi:hypothetical protein